MANDVHFDSVNDDWRTKMQERREQAKQEIEEEQFFLKERFKQENISKVEIDFFGCGDEGEIGDITCTSSTSDTPVHIPKSLEDRVENYTYAFLETTGVDWVNNEGGQGKIVLDIDNESFSYFIEQNEMVRYEALSGVEDM